MHDYNPGTHESEVAILCVCMHMCVHLYGYIDAYACVLACVWKSGDNLRRHLSGSLTGLEFFRQAMLASRVHLPLCLSVRAKGTCSHVWACFLIKILFIYSFICVVNMWRSDNNL